MTQVGVDVCGWRISGKQVGQVQMSDIVVVDGEEKDKDNDDNDGGSESQESKPAWKTIVTLVVMNVGHHWHSSQFRTPPRSLQQRNGTPFH